MKLHSLSNPAGKKARKRVGRGDSSQMGKTCGRGQKGQGSRSGCTYRPYFEGGQIPLFRRLPLYPGFTSINHKNYNLVNLKVLEALFNDGDTVTMDVIKEKGLVSKELFGLKILGDGEITKSLKVKADKFSKAAKEKIEAAGGTCEQA